MRYVSYFVPAWLLAMMLVVGCSALEMAPVSVSGAGTTSSPSPSDVSGDGSGSSGSNGGNGGNGNSSNTEASPTPTPSTTPSPSPTRACENSNLRICDDFEFPGGAGQPNTTFWTVNLTNNQCTAKVTKERVYDGNYSLHVHTNNPSGGAGATLHNTSMFPAPNDTFYGRVFAYFDGALPNTHSSMMKTGGQVGGNNEYDWSFGTSVGLLLIDYNAPTVETYSRAQSAKLPTGAWTCIEWAYEGDNQEAHLWINGQEQTDVAVTKQNQNPAWTAPPWDHVYFGWEFYNQDTGDNISTVDVYFDDVAFDYNRIGCSTANLGNVP